MIDLSIIIVSYNTKKLTAKCIESIVKNTHKISYEIIIVDNASNDGSVEFLNQFCRENPDIVISLIKNNSNVGYAKANNQGIKKAKGKAILLLNSDTIISENSIDNAYKHLKNADILTINLKNPDMTNQQAAGFGPNFLNIFCWAFFLDDFPFVDKIIKPYQISKIKYFEKTHEVDWVMGAFFLMKREVVQKIGYLDEKIFMYGEEMEFCKRAQLKKFKIYYFSSPSIVHLGMGSADTCEGAIIGEYKALKYFFRKYYSKHLMFFLIILLKISILLRMLIYSIIDRTRYEIYKKAFKII